MQTFAVVVKGEQTPEHRVLPNPDLTHYGPFNSEEETAQFLRSLGWSCGRERQWLALLGERRVLLASVEPVKTPPKYWMRPDALPKGEKVK